MKKKLSFLMLLSILFGSIAHAASYSIWIAGTQVTDNNKDNITGEGIHGRVTFDSENRCLDIYDGTEIGRSGENAVYILDKECYTIRIHGTVTLRSRDVSTIRIVCNGKTAWMSCFITGATKLSKLIIESFRSNGIYIRSYKYTVLGNNYYENTILGLKNIEVQINAEESGIKGHYKNGYEHIAVTGGVALQIAPTTEAPLVGINYRESSTREKPEVYDSAEPIEYNSSRRVYVKAGTSEWYKDWLLLKNSGTPIPAQPKHSDNIALVPNERRKIEWDFENEVGFSDYNEFYSNTSSIEILDTLGNIQATEIIGNGEVTALPRYGNTTLDERIFTCGVGSAKFYGIFIADEQVNSYNKDDIFNKSNLASDEIQGDASFEPITRTLTLNDATIISDKICIFNVYDISKEVTIKMDNVTVESTGDKPAIASESALHILASRDVSITGKYAIQIMGDEIILTLKSVQSTSGWGNSENNIHIHGRDIAITTDEPHTRLFLHIEGSNTDVTHKITFSGETQIFDNLWENQGCIVERLGLIKPYDAQFRSWLYEPEIQKSTSNFVYKGQRAKNLFFSNRYPIWVNGTQITSDNSNDVLRDGTVSYSINDGNEKIPNEDAWETPMLSLNNAQIRSTKAIEKNEVRKEYAIYAEDDLIVCTVNESNIELTGSTTSKNIYGICSEKDLTIIGDQTLNIKTQKTSNSGNPTTNYGLSSNGSLTIGASNNQDGPSQGILTINSLNTGMWANIFNVIDGTIKISTPEITSGAAIHYREDFNTSTEHAQLFYEGNTQEDMQQVQNLIFNGSKRSKQCVQIIAAPQSFDGLALYVEDRLVVPINALDILNDGGTVTYNDNTKTLTLNNTQTLNRMEITGPNPENLPYNVHADRAISNNNNGDIHINLKNHNKVYPGTNAVKLHNYKNIKQDIYISGNGSLELIGWDGYLEQYFYATGDITVSEATITTSKTDLNWGSVFYSETGVFKFENNATIEVTSGKNSNVFETDNNSAINVSVYSGAIIKAGNNKETAVEVSADQLAGKKYVSIKPNGTGIDHLSANKHTFNSWSTHGVLHIAVSESFMQQANRESLLIYNLLGSSLYNAELSYNYYQIPMKPGVYIVRIGTHTKKVVVR